LFVVVWVVVLDSQSVIVSSNVLMPDECSLGWHSGLDLESNTISEWVCWETWSSLVNVPGLVQTGVASPHDNVCLVCVSLILDIKATSTDISDVLS